MAMMPFSRSTAETLPQVKTTNPYFGKRRFAFKTSSLSFLYMFASILKRHKVPLRSWYGWLNG